MSTLKITQQLPLRSLIVVLIAFFGLTATAGYLYVLKPSFIARHASDDELFNLRRANPAAAPADVQLAEMEAKLESLKEQLHSNGVVLPANEMVAYVIGRLDQLAQAQQVQLLSVEPGDVAQVMEFDEIPFHMEIVGGYFRLVDWLNDAERDLGPMVIKSFDLSPAGGADSRRMRLTMVSYRPAGDTL